MVPSGSSCVSGVSIRCSPRARTSVKVLRSETTRSTRSVSARVSVSTRSCASSSRSSVDAKAAVLQEPTEAARNYVTALLANDLATAVTWSAPLLAARLADSPAVPRGQYASPVSIDLLLLDSDDRSADVAVELHGSEGRIAALRVELVLTAKGWRVAGVQP